MESTTWSRLTDDERTEADNISLDAIHAITDLKKLFKFARYLQSEGFEQTAQACVIRARVLDGGSDRVDQNHISQEDREEFLEFQEAQKKAQAKARAERAAAAAGIRASDDRSPQPPVRQVGAAVRGKAAGVNVATIVEQNMHRPAAERMKTAEIHRLKGNEEYKVKAWKEAINSYTISVKVFPNAEGYGNRAAVLLRQGKYQEAAADCTQALTLNPKFVKAYIRRSRCYAELKRHREALQDAEAGLALSPDARGRAELQELKIAAMAAAGLVGVDVQETSDDDEKLDDEAVGQIPTAAPASTPATAPIRGPSPAPPRAPVPTPTRAPATAPTSIPATGPTGTRAAAPPSTPASRPTIAPTPKRDAPAPATERPSPGQAAGSSGAAGNGAAGGGAAGSNDAAGMRRVAVEEVTDSDTDSDIGSDTEADQPSPEDVAAVAAAITSTMGATAPALSTRRPGAQLLASVLSISREQQVSVASNGGAAQRGAHPAAAAPVPSPPGPRGPSAPPAPEHDGADEDAFASASSHGGDSSTESSSDFSGAQSDSDASEGAAFDDDPAPIRIPHPEPEPPATSDEAVAALTERANAAKAEGNAKFASGDYRGALRCYEEGISLLPDREILHNNVAMAHLKLGSDLEALRAASVAVQLNKQYSKALEQRGRAKQKMGYLEGAVEDFRAALQAATTDERQRALMLKLLRGVTLEVVERDAVKERELRRTRAQRTTQRGATVIEELDTEEDYDAKRKRESAQAAEAEAERQAERLQQRAADATEKEMQRMTAERQRRHAAAVQEANRLRTQASEHRARLVKAREQRQKDREAAKLEKRTQRRAARAAAAAAAAANAAAAEHRSPSPAPTASPPPPAATTADRAPPALPPSTPAAPAPAPPASPPDAPPRGTAAPPNSQPNPAQLKSEAETKAFMAEAHKAAGIQHYKNNELPAALERFEEARIYSPEDPRILNNIARVFLELGECRKAAAAAMVSFAAVESAANSSAPEQRALAGKALFLKAQALRASEEYEAALISAQGAMQYLPKQKAELERHIREIKVLWEQQQNQIKAQLAAAAGRPQVSPAQQAGSSSGAAAPGSSMGPTGGKQPAAVTAERASASSAQVGPSQPPQQPAAAMGVARAAPRSAPTSSSSSSAPAAPNRSAPPGPQQRQQAATVTPPAAAPSGSTGSPAAALATRAGPAAGAPSTSAPAAAAAPSTGARPPAPAPSTTAASPATASSNGARPPAAASPYNFGAWINPRTPTPPPATPAAAPPEAPGLFSSMKAALGFGARPPPSAPSLPSKAASPPKPATSSSPTPSQQHDVASKGASLPTPATSSSAPPPQQPSAASAAGPAAPRPKDDASKARDRRLALAAGVTDEAFDRGYDFYLKGTAAVRGTTTADWKLAVVMLNLAVRDVPCHGRSWANKTLAHLMREEWQEVVDSYAKAIALDMGSEKLEYRVAKAHFELGEMVQALGHVKALKDSHDKKVKDLLEDFQAELQLFKQGLPLTRPLRRSAAPPPQQPLQRPPREAPARPAGSSSPLPSQAQPSGTAPVAQPLNPAATQLHASSSTPRPGPLDSSTSSPAASTAARMAQPLAAMPPTSPSPAAPAQAPEPAHLPASNGHPTTAAAAAAAAERAGHTLVADALKRDGRPRILHQLTIEEVWTESDSDSDTADFAPEPTVAPAAAASARPQQDPVEAGSSSSPEATASATAATAAASRALSGPAPLATSLRVAGPKPVQSDDVAAAAAVKAASAATAMLRTNATPAVDVAKAVRLQVPRSSTEFERKCNELSGRTKELVEYVHMIPPELYGAIFKTLTKETLQYVADALPHIVKTDDAFAMAALARFMTLDGFSFVGPMLGNAWKAKLRAVVATLAERRFPPMELGRIMEIYRLSR